MVLFETIFYFFSKILEMVWSLDLPKDQAVENAFSFMNLSHHLSNEEINSRFRQLCLQYHPDKDGDLNEFHKLQTIQ